MTKMVVLCLSDAWEGGGEGVGGWWSIFFFSFFNLHTTVYALRKFREDIYKIDDDMNN